MKKMLSITEGNGNPDHRGSLLPVSIAIRYICVCVDIDPCVGEDAEELELCPLLVGMQNGAATLGTEWESPPPRLKIVPPHDLCGFSIKHLSIYSFS